jgi:hypothetical protein
MNCATVVNIKLTLQINYNDYDNTWSTFSNGCTCQAKDFALLRCVPCFHEIVKRNQDYSTFIVRSSKPSYVPSWHNARHGILLERLWRFVFAIVLTSLQRRHLRHCSHAASLNHALRRRWRIISSNFVVTASSLQLSRASRFPGRSCGMICHLIIGFPSVFCVRAWSAFEYSALSPLSSNFGSLRNSHMFCVLGCFKSWYSPHWCHSKLRCWYATQNHTHTWDLSISFLNRMAQLSRLRPLWQLRIQYIVHSETALSLPKVNELTIGWPPSSRLPQVDGTSRHTLFFHFFKRLFLLRGLNMTHQKVASLNLETVNPCISQ